MKLLASTLLLLTLAPAGIMFSQEPSHPLKKGTASSTTQKPTSPSLPPVPAPPSEKSSSPAPKDNSATPLPELKLTDKQKSTVQALLLRQQITINKLRDAASTYAKLQDQLTEINKEGQVLETGYLIGMGLNDRQYALALDDATGGVILVERADFKHETPTPTQSK